MNLLKRLCLTLSLLVPTMAQAQLLANAYYNTPRDVDGYISWAPARAIEQQHDDTEKEPVTGAFGGEVPFIEVPAIVEKDESNLDEIISRLRRTEYTFSERDIQCMARNIFHEAANEPYDGMVLVGVVTLNRLANPKYPKTVCDVIYQRGPYSYFWKNRWHKVTVCQFSWTCERVRLPREGDPRWIKSLQIATNLAQGMYGSLRQKWSRSHHYHAYYVNPGWNIARIGRVGAHIFYE